MQRLMHPRPSGVTSFVRTRGAGSVGLTDGRFGKERYTGNYDLRLQWNWDSLESRGRTNLQFEH